MAAYCLKINHVPRGDKRFISSDHKKRLIRFISWSINQLWCFVPANICVLQQLYISTWSVLTNQISNFKRSNYKFSLYLRAEALNKPTWIMCRQCGHWDVLWSWICQQMEEVVRARNPFHLTQVLLGRLVTL